MADVSGDLYHSGSEPLHALCVEVSGVGIQEVEVLVTSVLPRLSLDGTDLRIWPEGGGYRVRLRADLTEVQATFLVDELYRARRLRGEHQP